MASLLTLSGIGVPFKDAKLGKSITRILHLFVRCEEETINSLWQYPNMERCL